jgi:hypothetical protein
MNAGNQYNEHWTKEQSESFLIEALELSKKNGYDFIGEVAKDLGSYVDVFDYIIKKFPELKHYKTQIKRNCEANCFSSGKKGDIIPSLAIMNLKSNHGWTDRIDTTTKDKELPTTTINLGNGLKPE